jgi:arginine exporter protein ArgO
VRAVGLFSITALLALPAKRLERMQANRGVWSALNVACGLTILIGAALMRTVAKAVATP